MNIFLAPGRFGHYTGLYWAYYAPYNILTNTSHNIFWMKKTKVYADLGQQKMVLGPNINEHNKSISTNTQLSMPPCKNISHIQVLVTNFFPTPLINLKLGPQVCGGRLLIATHLDQSNYLPNHKQVSKYSITQRRSNHYTISPPF